MEPYGDEFFARFGHRCASRGDDAPATLSATLELLEALPIDQRRSLDVEQVVSQVLSAWDDASSPPAPRRDDARWHRVGALAAAVIALLGVAGITAVDRTPPEATSSRVAATTSDGEVTDGPRATLERLESDSVALPGEPPLSADPLTPVAEPPRDASPRDPVADAPLAATADGQEQRPVGVVAVGLTVEDALERLPDELVAIATFEQLPGPDDVPEELDLVVVVADPQWPGLCSFLERIQAAVVGTEPSCDTDDTDDTEAPDETPERTETPEGTETPG